MFDHPNFELLTFEQVPLDRDLYIRNAACIPEYERGVA